MNLLEEFRKRKLIFQATPNIDNFFKKRGLLYMGIDPTADGLHLGHFLGLSIIKRLLLNGFKVILVLGGGTARIGDPSGKTKERPILPLKVLEKNKISIKREIKKILPFPQTSLKIIDNSLWLDKLYLLNFLRDVGKFISINSMLDLEFVRTRIQTQEFISFAEFTYQLLQAYDFLILNQKYNCELQIGGSDQWGNIVQGIELIRKKLNKEAYGFVFPLLTDPKTGRKFGKTEGGEILWLNHKKTHPFKVYQFIVNLDDTLAKELIYFLSFKNLEEIEKLVKVAEENKENRIIQEELAKEIIITVHGKRTYEEVKEISNILFDKDIEELQERDIEKIKEAIPSIRTSSRSPMEEILVSLSLAVSKSEARNLIKNQSVKFRKVKNYIFIKRGKKHFGLVELI